MRNLLIFALLPLLVTASDEAPNPSTVQDIGNLLELFKYLALKKKDDPKGPQLSEGYLPGQNPAQTCTDKSNEVKDLARFAAKICQNCHHIVDHEQGELHSKCSADCYQNDTFRSCLKFFATSESKMNRLLSTSTPVDMPRTNSGSRKSKITPHLQDLLNIA